MHRNPLTVLSKLHCCCTHIANCMLHANNMHDSYKRGCFALHAAKGSNIVDNLEI